LPVGWFLVTSVLKSSQPHGVWPASAVQVIPYWLLPFSEDAKHW
jgi:hypothetical protein